MTEGTRFAPDVLRAFISRIFVAAGIPQDDADLVADLMTRSDLEGSDTHGIFRLKMYVGAVLAGKTSKTPNIHIERESGNTAVVHGDDGLGHLAMNFATKLAIKKAKENGMSWIGINHGNHAGPASLWAKMLLEHDMIGIYSAVAGVNHVAPWGGTDLLLGTNPIAFAVPGLEEPAIVLDMATTVSSAGKIQVKAQRGESMPEGWMIGNDGKPLTDSSRMKEGSVLPIGGPKGYGLALMIGLLAGTLNGAAFGKNVDAFTDPGKNAPNTGQFIAAISIEAFGDVEGFKRQVDDVIRSIKASPLMPGFEAIRLPGEQSHMRNLDRIENGIPIHDKLKTVLNGMADDLKVEGL
jgi:L-2-hydroxycarboxylate dehydrogenase (NAD+)